MKLLVGQFSPCIIELYSNLLLLLLLYDVLFFIYLFIIITNSLIANKLNGAE
jgi:hypothetical protein